MPRASLAALVVAAALGVPANSSSARDPDLAAALALVKRQCPSPSAGIATDEWVSGWTFNALYGNCEAGDGRDQHVWLFKGPRLLRTDTREPDSSKDIIGLWRTGDTIAFMYVLYRRSDSNCCPTGGGEIVRFQLRGNHVRNLDLLPPHQLGSIAIGR